MVGESVTITVVAENEGGFTETFDVTAYYIEPTTPTPEQWDTFWSMGDVNEDGYIDMIDFSLIADHLWTSDPQYDINKDDIVNGDDLGICGANQGKEIWTYFGLPHTIGKQTVDNLPAGNPTTLTFSWNTAGVPPGTYPIKAVADNVAGETDTDDNTYVDGVVEINPKQYTLFVQSTIGGTTNPPPGSYTYIEGTSVKAKAIPDSNWKFVYWTLDWDHINTIYDNPITVTMYSDHILKAYFSGPGCVAEGTLITMADRSSKPVEEIEKGDTVLGFDPTTGSFVTEEVLAVTSAKVDLIENINDGGLRLTPTDQPIYIRNSTYEGWLRDPEKIEVGWEILDAEASTWVAVASIAYEEGKTRVYDFTTDGYQTYLANSYLVMDKRGGKK